MTQTVYIREGEGPVIALGLPLHEAIADRLFKGYLQQVNKDGTPFVEPVPRERPPITARKPDWVSWAVYKGCAPDDADASTKTDLIEKYGL